jgi:outer membrane protein assembly factor BamB
MKYLQSRLLALACVLVLLPGCSTVKDWFTFDDDEDVNQPAKLESITSEIRIKKLWSTGVGDGQGTAYNHLRPAISGDVIYAAGNDGVVMALDKMTGKRLWSQDFELDLSGAVGVDEGLVLIGSSNGDLLALTAADGTELWRTEVHGEIMAPPQTNGKIVVVQSYNGKLHGLNASDGTEVWAYDSNVPVLTLRGTSTPIIVEKTVIAAFGNGKVLAFDIATGATRWEVRVAIAQGRSEIDRIVDIDGTMVLMGTSLYVVSYQGRLAAIDVSSGRKTWQEDASSYAGLDQGFGNIYLATDKGSVIAYQRSGQGVRWEQAALENRRLSSPRVIRGYVAVGDLAGYIHFLSQVDGRFVGRTRIGSSGVRADMLAESNILYVYENGGKLAALQVSSLDKK